jgi:hypothetical protein
VLLSKLSRLERRAPEVPVSYIGSSGRWRPCACACEYFVPASVRKFRYGTKVSVGAVCTHVRMRENCSGFRPEVSVWTGSFGPGTESFGGPELTDKPNGLISFDQKFRWLPPELLVAHLTRVYKLLTLFLTVARALHIHFSSPNSL